MLIAIHGRSMLIPIHGVKHYAQCCKKGESSCSLLYMDSGLMLIVVHELKLYAHCYSWCKALC